MIDFTWFKQYIIKYFHLLPYIQGDTMPDYLSMGFECDICKKLATKDIVLRTPQLALNTIARLCPECEKDIITYFQDLSDLNIPTLEILQAFIENRIKHLNIR